MSAKLDALTEKMEANIPLTLDELKYLRRHYRTERTGLLKSLDVLAEMDTHTSNFGPEIASRREQVELGIEKLNDLDTWVTETIELVGRKA